MPKNQTDDLADIIAANFYSGFLIPLSSRYSTTEWNAALRKAMAVRAGRSGHPSPAGPDRDQHCRKADPPHGVKGLPAFIVLEPKRD